MLLMDLYFVLLVLDLNLYFIYLGSDIMQMIKGFMF